MCMCVLRSIKCSSGSSAALSSAPLQRTPLQLRDSSLNQEDFPESHTTFHSAGLVVAVEISFHQHCRIPNPDLYLLFQSIAANFQFCSALLEPVFNKVSLIFPLFIPSPYSLRIYCTIMTTCTTETNHTSIILLQSTARLQDHLSCHQDLYVINLCCQVTFQNAKYEFMPSWPCYFLVIGIEKSLFFSDYT